MGSESFIIHKDNRACANNTMNSENWHESTWYPLRQLVTKGKICVNTEEYVI